jgi:hypothetical protein
MATKNNNKIIIVGGGKGGVGKSMVTLGIVDALIASRKQVVLVESDDSNPDTYKALSKLVTSAICNLDAEEGYMALGDIIEKNEDAYVVVNSAARATKGIIKHGGIIADVVAEQGRELVMLWPINRQRDSVELLREFLDGAVGYAATYVLKNTYFGAAEKFARYDASTQKKRVTETLEYPELNDLLTDKIIDQRLSFSNATDATEGLSISERSVLTRFRTAVQKAFEVVL